jgi:hypothetical protein
VCCLFSLVDLRLSLCIWHQFLELPTKEPLFQGTFCFSFFWKCWSSLYCHIESSRIHYWVTGMVVFHSGDLNAPSASNASPPPQEHQPHVDPFLLHPVGLLPFLLPSPSESLKLVTRWIRRRRKGRLRRRKISKGPNFQPLQDMLEAINQLLSIMLGVLMRFTSLPRQLASPNSLAGFVRVTTFLRISLVFPRS